MRLLLLLDLSALAALQRLRRIRPRNPRLCQPRSLLRRQPRCLLQSLQSRALRSKRRTNVRSKATVFGILAAMAAMMSRMEIFPALCSMKLCVSPMMLVAGPTFPLRVKRRPATTLMKSILLLMLKSFPLTHAQRQTRQMPKISAMSLDFDSVLLMKQFLELRTMVANSTTSSCGLATHVVKTNSTRLAMPPIQRAAVSTPETGQCVAARF
mmetsp:Transcript_8913/g.15659  ORF Transcript_8913/g.15659 Transcript_8913/m.15659 type:complete len:211 (+) Transcript_8913:853-1485(+)